MDYTSILLYPLNILFFIVIAGLAIGKIQIKGVSVGIAGVLFVAIITGYILNRFIPPHSADIFAELRDTMKIFSTLGTSLFVSVIGLQTGLSINGKSINSIIALLIGSIMSIAGVTAMLLISLIDTSITISSLLGILCGALTSSPGLSSVCELVKTDSENAVWGYSCAYLFGVILAVLFAQLSSLHTNEKSSDKSYNFYVKSKIYPELILVCISALLGTVLGAIRIPFIGISIGNTAAILFSSLCVGLFVSKAKRTVSEQALRTFSILGLSLFFTGAGFITGTQIVRFDIRTMIYGIIISLTAIIFGLLLCKIISRRHQIHCGFIIAGGMTSSPAYGAINKKSDLTSAKLFPFAYFGALISLLIAIQIILH